MELSQEKIVFKASKNVLRFFLPFLFAVMGLLLMYFSCSVFDSRTNYHSQEEFLTFCYGLAIVIGSSIMVKKNVTQQFYMTETGIIRRNGISGKWSQVDFGRMDRAAVRTVYSEQGLYRKLTIVCLNHQVLTIGSGYTNESMDRAAKLLTNNHIPMYRSSDDAKLAAATTNYARKEPAPAEPLNVPSNVCLHCGVTCLALLVIVCLFVGGVLNSRCGTQKDMVMYGTVLSTAIFQEKDSSTGKMVLRSGQKKDSFSVTPQFVAHLRTGDQVKVHYTRGCFGLDYGVTFKKL